jgi:tetratricopeptide (TPR) repeat protein
MRARLTDFLVARPDRSGHWMASAFLIVLMGFVLQSGCSDQGAATKSVDASGADSSGPIDDERIDVGIKLLSEGRLQEAGLIFDTVAGQHPDMARANFYKGLALHQAKSHASALSWYQAAAESDQPFKERDTLLYYRGWCYYYSGEPELAREQIDVFLAGTDDRSDAHFLSGIISLDAGELEPAEQSLLKAIELSNSDLESQQSMARAWIRLADVYSQEQAFDKAHAAVERAIELLPDLSQAWFRKYTILMRLGDDEGAEVARKRWKELSAFGGDALESTP